MIATVKSVAVDAYITGGFTAVPVNDRLIVNPWMRGYMVAAAGHERIVDDLTESVITEYVEYARTVEEFDTSDAWAIGGWFDNESGKWFLDLSQKFNTYGGAMLAASERNQIAVWDIQAGAEIRL